MRKVSLFIAAIALTSVAVFGLVLAQEKDQGGRPLKATLTGAAEVPGPGDPDGAGSAKITLNQGKGEVCFELTVSNIAPASAAHIHSGAPDAAGPVVVTLTPPPAEGSSKGCVSASADLIKEIRQNPANYYINVHNADFPDGAVRGQLSK
ncbi:MAG TPA: CHRD domain-containing protein [Pyrinomonadaceae bacterium]|nr:CHRD domain-containing protein [Pyrinomonadaceae bacterium]